MTGSEQLTPAGRIPSRDRLLELLRFALVGGSSTVLFMAIYTVAVSEGLPYGVGQVLAWGVSVLWGFALHHRYTFRTGHSGSPTGEAGLWRWIALQGSVMLVNFVGLTVLIDGLGLSKVLAQAILLPFIPLLTFVLSRKYVFTAQDA